MTENAELRKRLRKIQNLEQFVEIIAKEAENFQKYEIQKVLQKKEIKKKLTKNEKLLIEKIV